MKHYSYETLPQGIIELIPSDLWEEKVRSTISIFPSIKYHRGQKPPEFILLDRSEMIEVKRGVCTEYQANWLVACGKVHKKIHQNRSDDECNIEESLIIATKYPTVVYYEEYEVINLKHFSRFIKEFIAIWL